MEFKKIQLNGFKSFVDKTTFVIEKGLTGIVGPNGCGKSNIVESLRWCMGETSAKSMRGSGMEDVIFSGTANKPSKNIAEVNITLDNLNKEGPAQYKELDIIDVKRRIEKDKGSKFYINEKEVRAGDARMLFADLSTGAHSPSMISQGRIGSLVTAKPSDRRSILEEAAGISGIHARRHESELRLSAAENNLKRADELRRQQEKQLDNLKKQAEEATKYKLISEEIKKIEAGLYYLKLQDLDKEIKIENEINSEAEDEVSGLKIEVNHYTNIINEENSKLKPLREKNIENLSRLQRINLELKNLEEEEKRAVESIKQQSESLKTIDIDMDREKSIIIDSNSNDKRLKEEKKELLEFESKYFEIEKKSDQDLESDIRGLELEQKKLETTSNLLISNLNSSENIQIIKNSLDEIENSKKLMLDNNINEASKLMDNCINKLKDLLSKFENFSEKKGIEEISESNKKIKNLQNLYASSLSKNQSIKNEGIKRKERIYNIESEIDRWKNLNSNSEKMLSELKSRKNKILENLSVLEKQPQILAVSRGQSIENIKSAEKEKTNIESELNKAEEIFNQHNNNLKNVQEKMMTIREKRARSIATLEGLKKRRLDLLERINQDLNLTEFNIFETSDLFGNENLPDSLAQEEKLDKKKREREKLGSVNLRADEETNQYEKEIKKMEKDREDLVSAIIKLKASINELNQKGRERLIEAFDKVNRKFNEVYTKLFNGGNAKLELVDSDDPLEAGLEMLVSPPGKRLQSITLLSGGEQALTALSLIFAVFLTSPAPICVLDEVDAPLDDANVTRFCNLLDELVKITRTKFIIVTHHALTMSKMDRLYGITMPEKGISQLVAVDLQKAEGLVA
ncbi:MAG: chromosome segregation protein SMC [Candidatus Pelagibacterales bacterium]|nr:MAG: chromosome segregation protein SMC [Pelagibacterales bacterium]